MIRYEIDLTKHKAKVISTDTLASGSCKVDHIEITNASEDWADKTLFATFMTKDVEPITVPVTDGIAEIPWEVLRGPQFLVGFFWSDGGQVMTSTLIPCYVAPGAKITGTAAQPTPEIYEHFTEAAETASDLLQQALSKATTSYVYKEIAPPSQINRLYVDLEDYYYHESDMVLVFLNGEKLYEGYELDPVEGELYINFNPGVSGEIEVDIIAGMGGGANVDPTLSIPGEAADAKVTGDNIRRIDSEIENIEEDTANLNAEVGDLHVDLETASDNITALQGDMAQAQSDITGLQTNVQNVWGDLAIHDAKIRGLQSRMITAENNITLQGNRLSTAEGNITALQGRITTAEGDIDDLQDDMTQAQGDITGLQGRMTTAEGNITALGTRMTTAEGDISDLQAADTALDARVTALENIGLADHVGY